MQKGPRSDAGATPLKSGKMTLDRRSPIFIGLDHPDRRERFSHNVLELVNAALAKTGRRAKSVG